MKVAIYVNHPRDVDMVRAIGRWLNKYVIFTDNPECVPVFRKYNLKYRYVKDYRILVWEMARWNPSVFLQFCLNSYLFPRNGSINIFIPHGFDIYFSDRLHDYDFILVSNTFNYKSLETFGVSPMKLRIVGYPRFDLAIRNEEVRLNKAEQKVFDKYRENGWESFNSGLRVASFIQKVGARNDSIYGCPDLNVSHHIPMRKREKTHEKRIKTSQKADKSPNKS